MSLKQKHAFEGMEIVKKDYVTSGLSDTEFAASLAERIGRPYSVAQVRQYRTTLGIPNNAPRGPAERLNTAEDLIHQVVDFCTHEPKKPLPDTLVASLKEFNDGI